LGNSCDQGRNRVRPGQAGWEARREVDQDGGIALVQVGIRVNPREGFSFLYECL
jgi:hypothetical protein